VKTSESGIAFIKAREGFQPRAYKDGNGYSIGHGTFIDTAAEKVYLNRTITRDEADNLLRADLVGFEKTINSNISVSLNQNQFDALASLCYNLGSGRFPNLQVVKLINSRATDTQIKAVWLVSFITENGVRNQGLVNRRILESELFTSSYNSSLFALVAVLIIIYIIYHYSK
jgi:lysozyme